MKSNNRFLFTVTWRRTMLAAAFTMALAALAHACGWYFLHEHSVRFNGYSSASEFARLPGLPANPTRKLLARQKVEEDYGDPGRTEYDAGEERKKFFADMWNQATMAETQGDYRRTQRLLREFLSETEREPEYCWNYNPDEIQSQRNAAYDRLDALSALSQGASAAAVKAYLAARQAYDLRTGRLETLLAELPHHPALDDNAAYLRAAAQYRNQLYQEATDGFALLRKQYPRSEKREAALLMQGLAVRQLMTPLQRLGKPDDEPERYAALEQGRQIFQQLLREYPQGRFALDARGWLANLALQRHNHATALVEYYRILGAARDQRTLGSTVVSLRLTRLHANAAELREVEMQLADEPAAALAYAYHSLYNYVNAIAYEIYEAPDYAKDDYELQEKERRQLQSSIEFTERQRIVAFAARMMQRHGAVASAGFALRLAQAQAELKDHQASLTAVNRALQLGLTGRLRAEALLLKGSAAVELGQWADAQRALRQVRAEFPQTALAEKAGQLNAIAAEDAGDWEGALLQYLAMDYQDDVAYFADVLLTPAQLAQFIQRHPRHPRVNDFRYALAIRYLRNHQWSEARALLAQVKTDEQPTPDYSGYRDCTPDRVEFRSTCPTPKSYGNVTRMAAQWVLRDLQTANDLERLEQLIAEAQGDEAQAEALYQYASYFYQASSLLFYNPNLWTARHYKLQDMATAHGWRSPGEANLLWENMQSHEPVAHAIELYLEVVRRFPHTRAAADALYTAAVGHERLSGYNGYWREAYDHGLHAGAQEVTYADVRMKYPKYRFPRGTFGWEPATHTVNGGPGWAVPPQPQPRPTREQRLRALAREANQELKTRVRPLLQGATAQAQQWQATYDYYLFLIRLGLVLSLASYGGWHVYRLRGTFELQALQLNEELPAPSEKVTSYVERMIQ